HRVRSALTGDAADGWREARREAWREVGGDTRGMREMGGEADAEQAVVELGREEGEGELEGGGGGGVVQCCGVGVGRELHPMEGGEERRLNAAACSSLLQQYRRVVMGKGHRRHNGEPLLAGRMPHGHLSLPVLQL
ncbi:hypothetical protein GOP47_0027860, partial [Adiantum capillus-veneris]